jgi:hypothetical protein
MASAAALPTPSFGAAYARRQPEQSPLHRAVQGHLAAFLDQSEPPSFVARALRRFLDCGVLAKGFVRVYCDACKQEQLVAFSCKGRGFCPSCSARRASETAAHLVDSVLPQLPLRQFVLVMPFEWHHRLARDAELESKLIGLFVDELREHLREVTGVADGIPGTVTFCNILEAP